MERYTANKLYLIVFQILRRNLYERITQKKIRKRKQKERQTLFEVN